MKSECTYPCGSGDFGLGAVDGSDWVALSVDVNELVDQGLNLSAVDIGFAIWATDHDSTVFQVDNVRWVANPSGPSASSGNTGGTLSEWVKTDPSIGYQSAESYAGYTKVFSDEFDGTELNTDVWRFDIGTGSNGWGNNELEYYREENTSVENGLLVIEARKETFGGRAYTSSRIKTEDNFAFTYGRVDVRAVVAEGKGLWSAVWMLGQSFADISWPYSGLCVVKKRRRAASLKSDVSRTKYLVPSRGRRVYSIASWSRGLNKCRQDCCRSLSSRRISVGDGTGECDLYEQCVKRMLQ